MAEYLRGCLESPPSITAKKDRTPPPPIVWKGPGWTASFDFLAKGGSRAVYRVDDNWVLKYDFEAVRSQGAHERNVTELRYAEKYPWLPLSLSTKSANCIFQERGGPTLMHILREGNVEEITGAVSTLIPFVKKIAEIAGLDGIKMRDFKSHNVVRSLRGDGTGWLVIDIGGWVSIAPRVRRKDQLSEVLRDLNRNGCFDSARPGLWEVCKHWLLGPETDQDSWDKVLKKFLGQDDEEQMHPQRRPEEGEEGPSVVLDEASRGGSLVRAAVESWDKGRRRLSG